VTMGAGYRLLTVFCITQKDFEFFVAIKATKLIIWHTFLEKKLYNSNSIFMDTLLWLFSIIIRNKVNCLFR